MRAVILGMRLARSVPVLVPDDDPDSPYPRVSSLAAKSLLKACGMGFWLAASELGCGRARGSPSMMLLLGFLG
jgi:hypothetical protein